MKKLFNYKFFIQYFTAFGFAIMLISNMEPLLQLSKFAKLLLNHWEEAMLSFWTNILFFVHINLSIEIYKALTTSVFFLLLGIFSNEYILKQIKSNKLKKFTARNIKISFLFNIVFFLLFSIMNLFNFYASNIGMLEFTQILVWSSPFLIFSYSLFIVSVKISISPLLRKKIFISLIIVITLLFLDKSYEPLKYILDKISS